MSYVQIYPKDAKRNNEAYLMPWESDAICYNFHVPEVFIPDDAIEEMITDPLKVETLVVTADLKDYDFIEKMKNLRIRKPTFPRVPVFNSDIEALAGLDLYIDSLDSYFKDLDKQFSSMNLDLENVSNVLRRGSRGFAKSRVRYDYDDLDMLRIL